MQQRISLVLMGLILLLVATGCGSLSGSSVQALQPEDVQDLVMVATSVYLKEHPVPPATLAKMRDTLFIARGQLTQKEPNLSAVKGLLVDQLSPEWKPLGSAGLSILNRRVHLDELIQAGQTQLASRYVLAAIDGASEALTLRGTP